MLFKFATVPVIHIMTNEQNHTRRYVMREMTFVNNPVTLQTRVNDLLDTIVQTSHASILELLATCPLVLLKNEIETQLGMQKNHAENNSFLPSPHSWRYHPSVSLQMLVKQFHFIGARQTRLGTEVYNSR